jgi:hypothetical protein
MCERQNEDGCHLFFKCKYALPVWRELGLEHIRGALAALHSAKEVIKMILGMKEGEQMKVMVLLRQWWLERNRVREGRRDEAHRTWQCWWPSCLTNFRQ